MKLKFIWRPKRRQTQVHKAAMKVIRDDSHLHFIAAPPPKRRLARAQRARYATTLLRSSAEDVLITSKGQPIGKTPLVIIGPVGHQLTLMVGAGGQQNKLKVQLGKKEQAEILVQAPQTLGTSSSPEIK